MDSTKNIEPESRRGRSSYRHSSFPQEALAELDQRLRFPDRAKPSAAELRKRQEESEARQRKQEAAQAQAAEEKQAAIERLKARLAQALRPAGSRTPVRLPATDQTPAFVQVPLNDAGEFAMVDATDFDRLCASAVSDQWFVNGNGRGRKYVRVNHGPKGNVIVARLIMECGPKQTVRMRGPNMLDLRRTNLRLVGNAEQVGEYLDRHPECA